MVILECRRALNQQRCEVHTVVPYSPRLAKCLSFQLELMSIIDIGLASKFHAGLLCPTSLYHWGYLQFLNHLFKRRCDFNPCLLLPSNHSLPKLYITKTNYLKTNPLSILFYILKPQDRTFSLTQSSCFELRTPENYKTRNLIKLL